MPLLSAHCRVWAPGAPLTAQATPLVSPVTVPRVHVRAAGSGSLSVVPVAEPGPALDTTIENDAGSPASTWPSFGVFTTLTSGHWTVMWPGSVSSPSLVESMWPLLSISPHVAGVVWLVTVTVPLTGA